MNINEQKVFFEAFVNRMRDTMFKKGDDYATEEDRLSNFKFAGDICRLNAKLNCLSNIATKVARIGVLIHKKDAPKNESLEDSLLDLANYAILEAMILKDEKDATQKGEEVTEIPYLEGGYIVWNNLKYMGNSVWVDEHENVMSTETLVRNLDKLLRNN